MSTYSDLNLAFRKHPNSNDVLKKTDVEAVKASLRNILLNNPFDIPFDPDFGGALRSYLFELQSPSLSAAVKRNIKLKVEEYDSRVVIEDIVVTSKDNELIIEILFYVVGISGIQQLKFTLERTR